MGKLFFKKIIYTHIIKNLRNGHNNLINDVEIVSVCEVKLGSDKCSVCQTILLNERFISS